MFNCIVKSCAANVIIFIFHVRVERLHVKMFIERINFIQYGKPLRSFSQAVFL